MECPAVNFRKNRNGPDAQLPAGPDYTHSYFASVGNEYFFKHSRSFMIFFV
jgi:hypothetical protein